MWVSTRLHLLAVPTRDGRSCGPQPRNLKNITLECGGKSPLIVFEDANLDQAVKWAHGGIMDNSGQVCTSTSRIYVHELVYDEFVQTFVEHTKKVTSIGNPFGENVNHGPQVSKVQFDRVLSFIDQGRQAGAKTLTGGASINGDGYFIEPTVFTEVRDMEIACRNNALTISQAEEGSTIVRDEIFGPVVVRCSNGNTAEGVVSVSVGEVGDFGERDSARRPRVAAPPTHLIGGIVLYEQVCSLSRH